MRDYANARRKEQMKALFFWVGGEIEYIFINCIKSFAAKGFETIVYSPQPEMNSSLLGSEIESRNSEEILPINLLYKFKQLKPRKGPCYSAYSNLFRAKLIQAHPGSWYFDTDVFCLKEKKHFTSLVESSKGKLILGRQGPASLNGAILSVFDKEICNHYVNALFDFAEQKNYLHNWGDFGPSFLNNYAKNYPDHIMEVNQEYFYALNPGETSYFYDPSLKEIGLDKIKESVCIHIWNECLTMASIPVNCPPPKSSLLHEVMKESIDIEDSFALPKDTAIKLLYPPQWGIKKTLSNIIPSFIAYLKRKLI